METAAPLQAFVGVPQPSVVLVARQVMVLAAPQQTLALTPHAAALPVTRVKARPLETAAQLRVTVGLPMPIAPLDVRPVLAHAALRQLAVLSPQPVPDR